jgi:hypothetical protein
MATILRVAVLAGAGGPGVRTATAHEQRWRPQIALSCGAATPATGSEAFFGKAALAHRFTLVAIFLHNGF